MLKDILSLGIVSLSFMLKKINFNKYPKVRNAVDILFGDISYMTERGKSMNKLTDFLLCQKKI